MIFVSAALLPCLKDSHAAAGATFNIEQDFAVALQVPEAVASDVARSLGEGELACVAEQKQTLASALASTRIELARHVDLILVRPRAPSSDGSTWGCLCGAYNCPMWVYDLRGQAPRRVLSAIGSSLTIIDREDRGLKRLLVDSGSAGVETLELFAWSGRTYAVMREKTKFLLLHADPTGKSERELARFRAHAAD